MPVEPNVKIVTEAGITSVAPPTSNSTDQTIGVVVLPLRSHSNVQESSAKETLMPEPGRTQPILDKNGVWSSSDDKQESKTVPAGKLTELIEQFREKNAVRNEEGKGRINGTIMTTGIEPKLEDVSLVGDSNVKINSDGFEEEAGHVRTNNGNSVREFDGNSNRKDTNENLGGKGVIDGKMNCWE